MIQASPVLVTQSNAIMVHSCALRTFEARVIISKIPQILPISCFWDIMAIFMCFSDIQDPNNYFENFPRYQLWRLCDIVEWKSATLMCFSRILQKYRRKVLFKKVAQILPLEVLCSSEYQLFLRYHCAQLSYSYVL